MKNLKLKSLLLFFLSVLILQHLNGQNILALDNPFIKYDGAFYIQASPTLVSFDRHKPEVYNHLESGIYGTWIRQWVITQTGIRIRFKTASPTIKFTFQQRSGGGTIGGTPTNGFAVFADSIYQTSFSSLSFTITNPNSSAATFYEVSLPNLWAVDLIGMELENSFNLVDPGVLLKPVYVALGDSKTHGTGQYVSSAKTYPFQLASMMKWNLNNMAVAGGGIGWAMALNLKGKNVDVVTMELGYNDWEYSAESLSSRQLQYEKLVDSIRLYQPNAKIYCISPITTSDLSGAAPYTLEEYRNMVGDIVNARKQLDSKIFFIPGTSISNTGMLASGDVVHLSEAGALELATNLKGVIEDPSTIVLNNASMDTMTKSSTIISISNTQLDIIVNKAGQYSFSIFTTDGKPIYNLSDKQLKEGENTISWNATNLKANNAYVIQIKNGTTMESYLKNSY